MTAPTVDAELHDAVGVIHDTIHGLRRHDPHRIVTAHNTVTRKRHHHDRPLGAAIDHYLADSTWHRGPLVLRAAIDRLAHQLGIPNPAIAHIAEQPSLFGPDERAPNSV